MSMKTLILIRGLPGSGKSTLAGVFRFPICCADDYFMEDGEYRFNPMELADAHLECFSNAISNINAGLSCVVANTFSQRWEMEPYISAAKKMNVKLFVIDLFDGGLSDEELASRNTHGVPVEAIRKMRDRWEHDWKNGSKERTTDDPIQEKMNEVIQAIIEKINDAILEGTLKSISDRDLYDMQYVLNTFTDRHLSPVQIEAVRTIDRIKGELYERRWGDE